MARAAGLDPRSKTLDELEPDAYLLSTGNKRLDPFKAALDDAMKAAQEENQHVWANTNADCQHYLPEDVSQDCEVQPE